MATEEYGIYCFDNKTWYGLDTGPLTHPNPVEKIRKTLNTRGIINEFDYIPGKTSSALVDPKNPGRWKIMTKTEAKREGHKQETLYLQPKALREAGKKTPVTQPDKFEWKK